MRFQYCPHCGTKAIQKEIGDEGLMPWCDTCKIPLFDMFSTCIIALVVNQYGEVALLRQSYISSQYHNLVSGYMQPGENAEECAAREIEEELGLKIRALRPAKTFWFARKDMLMIGFLAYADKADFQLSGEVDQAVWVDPEQALTMVHPGGAISHQLVEFYLTHRDPPAVDEDH